MQSSSLTTCIFIKDRTANYAHVDKQGMTNLQNNSFTLFSSRSWGGASRLLSLQLLVRNELLVLGKGLAQAGQARSTQPTPLRVPAMVHAEPRLADGTACSSIPSPGILHGVLTNNTLSWRSFLSYEHSRARSSCCRRRQRFSPLPSLPTQTRSRPRVFYTDSGMVLHFLGSVVLWGHRSLSAEITFKHKKTTTCKTWHVSGWEQPTAELSPLCFSSWLSLPQGFSSQRETWGFHFYWRSQLLWFFKKDFSI